MMKHSRIEHLGRPYLFGGHLHVKDIRAVVSWAASAYAIVGTLVMLAVAG